MTVSWEDQKDSFEVIDVRALTGNFLPMVMDKAKGLPVGEGICIVQSFDPLPLYSALGALGLEHSKQKISQDEYRAFFYRAEVKEPVGGVDMPFKPTAILNFKDIDEDLAEMVVYFWKRTWDNPDGAIDLKTKLLLSLSNAVGAGRFRQATRELIKAYALGTTAGELDELLSLFVWNQGIGNFASQIGPSPLFGAYRFIKASERQKESREDIVKKLVERFGEHNPNVGTLYHGKGHSGQ